MTRSAWRLRRPNGRATRCLLSEIEGRWDVIVWNDASVVLWERHPSAEAAGRRADELWTMLVAYGCEPESEAPKQEPTPFRRACPECDHAASGQVRYRRSGFLVMSCGACGRSWNDRERSGRPDRRTQARSSGDRRKAA